VFQIRIVFNTDPDTDADPAFYINAEPDPDPESQAWPSQKVRFGLEK
jgi:hypothetical protein